MANFARIFKHHVTSTAQTATDGKCKTALYVHTAQTKLWLEQTAAVLSYQQIGHGHTPT